jgi:hypothetical protein
MDFLCHVSGSWILDLILLRSVERNRSLNSTLGVVIWLRNGRTKNRGSIPAGARDFILLYNVSTDSAAQILICNPYHECVGAGSRPTSWETLPYTAGVVYVLWALLRSCQCLNYTASSGRMIGDTIPTFARRRWRKPRKLRSLAGVPNEIRTEHHPNTSLE